MFRSQMLLNKIKSQINLKRTKKTKIRKIVSRTWIKLTEKPSWKIKIKKMKLSMKKAAAVKEKVIKRVRMSATAVD